MIYNISDIETWREHQSELVREAEEARLARRLIRSPRPKKGWSVSALALGFLVTLALAALMLVGASNPAHASTTFTVTNTFDPGDGICNSSCTLRDAIIAANNTPNSGGPDLIHFAITGEGVKTISPSSALPAITDAVIIDGYTQPGASPNTLARGTNAKLLVELDGSNAGSFASGLKIEADVVVRGLAVGSFSSSGIEIDNDDGLGAAPSGVKIEGNFIGTDASGTLDRGNGFAGLLVNGDSHTVGGTSLAARNVISGNEDDGININSGSGHKVQGNLIGTKKDGIKALGNDFVGVFIHDASGNLIGGSGKTARSAANTIAFNGRDGVDIGSFFVDDESGNRVLFNSIFSNGGLGTDLRGGTENAAGATRNDSGDIDTGPNELQNKPVLVSATNSGTKTTIKGKLSSKPNQSFVVRFFSNPRGADAEGKKFIGQRSVSTDASGNASFSLRAGRVRGFVTATATDSKGNTSEFSAPRKVQRV